MTSATSRESASIESAGFHSRSGSKTSVSIHEALGIDVDELEWQDLALCAGMDTNWFYDEYDDEPVSHMVDEACLSCPVMKQCLEQGMQNSEWGVWGGIYLVSGKKDDNKNKYKTAQTWMDIKDRLTEDG